MRRVAALFVVGIGLGLILLAPAWWWLGESVVLESGVALSLCVIPAAGTMVWNDLAYRKSPEMQLLAVLGGSGVRLGVALGVGALLYFQCPDEFSAVFWGWLILFYLVLLALEIALIINPDKRSAGDESRTAD